MQQGLTPEQLAYLETKKVERLMEYLYHELLLALPADPLAHLSKLLETPETPKIIIAGPPAGGKGTQCEMIAKKYGVVHISTGDLLRDETRKGTPLGKQAQTYMSQGALVPDSLITQLVAARLKQDDVQSRGWLLDGFPRTRTQALNLQQMGIIPSVVIVLEVPDEVVASRIEGRRTDPKTGAVYHMKFNPPPPGVAVEQRADDTADAIKVRLGLFHRNTTEVLECYSTIAVHINGDRDKNDVFSEIAEQIEARVMC